MSTKPALERILVFGASGHIGGPCAEKIRRDAPDTTLRLVTHRDEAAADLRERFPDAEVVQASYFDLPSLLDAFADIQQHRKLVVPRNRRMAFLDTTETGECAAAVLLSDDAAHIGQIYHLDNGHDVLWFDEVAELASRALGVQITYDGTDEGFEEYCGAAIRAYIGTPDAVDYYLHYFQFEQDNETVWRKSDIVEFLTGRPAKRLEDWLVEHRDAVLGAAVVA